MLSKPSQMSIGFFLEPKSGSKAKELFNQENSSSSFKNLRENGAREHLMVPGKIVKTVISQEKMTVSLVLAAK